MDYPLVSIIMPAYNAEKYVAESMTSVLQQTYANWELLVVDDGSIDNTGSVIKQFASSDNRIKYFYQENGRQGRARNKGLQNANGEYVAFLDADDLWLPEKLTWQVELMLTNPVDLVFSDSYLFEGKPDFKRKIPITPGYFKGEKDFIHFLAYNRIPILTVLVKRHIVQTVNGFSEDNRIQNAEDFHLWLKLLLKGYSFLGIADVLTHYRMHTTSATAGDRHALFPVLHGLKDLAIQSPQYKTIITESFFIRVNNYLVENNIQDGMTIQKLLEFRNAMAKRKVIIPFWQAIHGLFGKRIFRIIFAWKQKMYSPKLTNVDLDQLRF